MYVTVDHCWPVRENREENKGEGKKMLRPTHALIPRSTWILRSLEPPPLVPGVRVPHAHHEAT